MLRLNRKTMLFQGWRHHYRKRVMRRPAGKSDNRWGLQNYLSDKILGKTDNDGGRSRCRIWSQNGRLIGSIIGKDESNRLLDLVRFSPITDKFSKNWILWYFWLREEMIDEKLTTPKKKFSMGDNKQCSTDNPGRTIWNLNIRYWRIRVISTILGRIHTSMSCLHLFRIF